MKILIIPLLLMVGCSVHKTGNKILPQKKNSIYSLKINSGLLEADPEIGGRIISLQLDGKNFFTGSDVNALYWGSSLWSTIIKKARAIVIIMFVISFNYFTSSLT